MLNTISQIDRITVDRALRDLRIRRLFALAVTLLLIGNGLLFENGSCVAGEISGGQLFGPPPLSMEPVQRLPDPNPFAPSTLPVEALPRELVVAPEDPVRYHADATPSTENPWLRPFENRALQAEPQEGPSQAIMGSMDLPEAFDPWWQAAVFNPLFPQARPQLVDIQALLYRALKHSPAVRAISRTPLIREHTIFEADAEFDTTMFMETKFLHLSEPIGSELTTGAIGPTSRFRDHDWDYSAGLRRRTRNGSRLELSQEYGLQNTNSEFFTPNHQGTAQLSLRFTQPLLNGRGRAYNTGFVVLAQIDTGVAWDQFSEQLQDHLLEVTHSYWRLYFGRASLLQRQRHYARAKQLLDELSGRAEMDVTTSQIALARAAVEGRTADLIRAETIVRDSETRIRSLVGDPDLTSSGALELIPHELPRWHRVEVPPREALLTALQHRAEVDEAFQQIQAACVRLNMAKNEVLPMLNFVMETYVRGLRGGSNVGQAWVDQFSVGEPTYSVGLVFEVPLGNRAARNRQQRRKLELKQMIDQFQSRMETLMAEVEIAVRQVTMSHREMLSTHGAMVAAESELYALEERWKLMPGDNQTSSFLLDELLNSQDRLANAELSFLDAQVTYTLSFSELNRALGTLFDCDRFSMTRVCDGDVSRLKFLEAGLGQGGMGR